MEGRYGEFEGKLPILKDLKKREGKGVEKCQGGLLIAACRKGDKHKVQHTFRPSH